MNGVRTRTMKTDMIPGATGTQNGNTGDISIFNVKVRLSSAQWPLERPKSEFSGNWSAAGAD